MHNINSEAPGNIDDGPSKFIACSPGIHKKGSDNGRLVFPH